MKFKIKKLELVCDEELPIIDYCEICENKNNIDSCLYHECHLFDLWGVNEIIKSLQDENTKLKELMS